MRWCSSPGTLRTLAVSLYKIGNDIRLMSCGPRAGFAELMIPENEPGSSIMPGKVNPTQAEALTMIAVQVMANDVAVGFGGAGGYLEMNVYKPLMIYNITHSITIMTDGCTNFRKFLVEGTKPNLKKIKEYVERSLMLVTALAPVIGYDKASKIAHYAMDHDLTLKAAALKLGFVTEAEFDRVVDPAKMVKPYVAPAWTVPPRRERAVAAGTDIDVLIGVAPAAVRERPDHATAWSRATARLGDALGLQRQCCFPRWGELTIRIDRLRRLTLRIVAAAPAGVDMGKVVATMGVVDDVCDGRIAPRGPGGAGSGDPRAAGFPGAVRIDGRRRGRGARRDLRRGPSAEA